MSCLSGLQEEGAAQVTAGAAARLLVAWRLRGAVAITIGVLDGGTRSRGAARGDHRVRQLRAVHRQGHPAAGPRRAGHLQIRLLRLLLRPRDSLLQGTSHANPRTYLSSIPVRMQLQGDRSIML